MVTKLARAQLVEADRHGQKRVGRERKEAIYERCGAMLVGMCGQGVWYWVRGRQLF